MDQRRQEYLQYIEFHRYFKSSKTAPVAATVARIHHE